MGGDFNTKSKAWGSTFSNERGQNLMDVAMSLGLVFCNVGDTPNFCRRDQASFLDVTFVLEKICNKVDRWQVLEYM